MNRPSRTGKGLVLSLQALIVIGTVAFWEAAGRLSRKADFFFSRPSAILGRILQWLTSGSIWANVGITMLETLLGFAAGVLLGILLAFACYRIPLVQRVLMPFFAVFNAMPRLVFAPIFILWFGLGLTSKVVLSASIIVFIVLFATYQGLQEVDPALIHKVRLLGGSERDVMRRVLLPSALTWVFTSLRTSVGFALAGVVVGEYTGASRGLGYLIQFAQGMLDATGVFAGLVVLSLTVILVNAALERIEARFTSWRL